MMKDMLALVVGPQISNVKDDAMNLNLKTFGR